MGKDKAILEGGELQPHDAHQILRGHQLRQGKHQQGAAQGSYEEEESQTHGPHQVRGEIQVREEQMVLPEAQVLDDLPCSPCCVMTCMICSISVSRCEGRESSL